MGFRFRKSLKIAPGVRLNLGKKSAGLSFGGKGLRYSVNSSGRKTTTVGVPGSGISYSKSTYAKKTKKGGSGVAAGQTQLTPDEYNAAMIKGQRKLLPVVILLGWTGVHYFMMGRKGMGFLYLFTFGLCGIGWIVDIIRIASIRPIPDNPTPQYTKPAMLLQEKTSTYGMSQEQAVNVRYRESKASGNLMDIHYALNGLVEYYYSNRDSPPVNADFCIQYCKEDIDLFPQLHPLFMADLGSVPRIPAFQRLAMMYDHKGEYQKAIEICDLGIKYGLEDGTQGGFVARKERLQKKLEAEPIT